MKSIFTFLIICFAFNSLEATHDKNHPKTVKKVKRYRAKKREVKEENKSLAEAEPLVKKEDLKEKQTQENHLEAAKKWLELVDKKEYGKSWDSSSSDFKKEVLRSEWIQLLDKNRSPLGSVVHRILGGESIVKNPKGLPEGEYAIVVYTTTFQNHKTPIIETIGLIKKNGVWKGYSFVMEEASSIQMNDQKKIKEESTVEGS